MKKTILTLAIIFGMTLGTMAQQQGGGLFGRGAVIEETSNDYNTRTGSLMLPNSHGESTDQNGPLGSGLAVLLGLGGAYLFAKHHKEE